MIDLDEFLQKIRPFAPGCADPVAMHHAREAAIEFCEKTRLWRDEDEFQLSEDQPEFIAVPAGAVLYEIESIRFDDRDIEPVSFAELDRLYPRWREDEGGSPRWAVQTEMDTIRIVPATSGTVRLQTILRPSEDAESLPDFLAKHYRQHIADGALSRILMLPGQTFTNPDMAMLYESRFVAGMDKLFDRSTRGQQRAPLRARPQFM